MLAELKPRLMQVIATQTDHPRCSKPEKIVRLVQPTGIPVEAGQARGARRWTGRWNWPESEELFWWLAVLLSPAK